jgi:hypothetical protein
MQTLLTLIASKASVRSTNVSFTSTCLIHKFNGLFRLGNADVTTRAKDCDGNTPVYDGTFTGNIKAFDGPAKSFKCTHII